MMINAIKNFPKQFNYELVVVGEKIEKYKHYVLIGMGGSHLVADLALCITPTLPLCGHNDYGLPILPLDELKKSLLIINSYSGNTEEALDALAQAQKKHLPVAVIAVGGKLIEIAKQKKLPYIQIPNTGIEPRSALGFSLRAFYKIMGEDKLLKESKKLAKTLQPEIFQEAGKSLALKLKNHIPVIYSSRANTAIAYNWKIKFNETGKIPAFYNVLPELNHNEMTGFDVVPSTKHLSDNLHFIFLEDPSDHPRIQKRMKILQKLYQDRGLPVETIALPHKNIFEKTFSSLLLADWTTLSTAEIYGVESEQVPMVEEFKKLMVE